MEFEKETKIAVTKEEIVITTKELYRAILRGQAATEIGNQKVMDANTKGVADMTEALKFFKEKLKELNGSAG